MKLKYYTRLNEKKSSLNTIRREGDIPASIYIKGKVAETIAVKGNEFSTIMRGVEPGRLPTVIFKLVDDAGKERRAVVKEIQYHVTNYRVLHLDFEELLDNVKINIKVPIEFTGVNDCVGVKLGGAIRQVIRHLRVRCLPKDIPTFFQLDVKEMMISHAKRLSDIEIPQTVRPLADLKEVAVVIVKR